MLRLTPNTWFLADDVVCSKERLTMTFTDPFSAIPTMTHIPVGRMVNNSQFVNYAYPVWHGNQHLAVAPQNMTLATDDTVDNIGEVGYCVDLTNPTMAYIPAGRPIVSVQHTNYRYPVWYGHEHLVSGQPLMDSGNTQPCAVTPFNVGGSGGARWEQRVRFGNLWTQQGTICQNFGKIRYDDLEAINALIAVPPIFSMAGWTDLAFGLAGLGVALCLAARRPLTHWEAVTLYSMWMHHDGRRNIDGDKALREAQRYLVCYARDKLTEDRIKMILGQLEQYGCIEMRKGRWYLREDVSDFGIHNRRIDADRPCAVGLM